MYLIRLFTLSFRRLSKQKIKFSYFFKNIHAFFFFFSFHFLKGYESGLCLELFRLYICFLYTYTLIFFFFYWLIPSIKYQHTNDILQQEQSYENS